MDRTEEINDELDELENQCSHILEEIQLLEVKQDLLSARILRLEKEKRWLCRHEHTHIVLEKKCGYSQFQCNYCDYQFWGYK